MFHETKGLHQRYEQPRVLPNLSFLSMALSSSGRYPGNAKYGKPDITPFEDAFKALDGQDVRTIEEATTKLEDQHAKFLRKILAFRALQLRKATVLRFCLEAGGFPYEAYFEDEANEVRNEEDPLTFQVNHLSPVIGSAGFRAVSFYANSPWS